MKAFIILAAAVASFCFIKSTNGRAASGGPDDGYYDFYGMPGGSAQAKPMMTGDSETAVLTTGSQKAQVSQDTVSGGDSSSPSLLQLFGTDYTEMQVNALTNLNSVTDSNRTNVAGQSVHSGMMGYNNTNEAGYNVQDNGDVNNNDGY